MSIHSGGGGSSGCSDVALSQLRLVHNGGVKRSIGCSIAFLNNPAASASAAAAAAAGVVYWGTNS